MISANELQKLKKGLPRLSPTIVAPIPRKMANTII